MIGYTFPQIEDVSFPRISLEDALDSAYTLGFSYIAKDEEGSWYMHQRRPVIAYDEISGAGEFCYGGTTSVIYADIDKDISWKRSLRKTRRKK